MDLTVRPIDVWPDGWRTPRERKANPFQTKSYSATLDLLDYELDRLAARTAHLQLAVISGDLRLDGHLRANAKVDHPGVILTIDSAAHGVLTYPCDTFAGRWSGDPPDWQINLRAIALGLEALRKVERYGIAQRGQQYAGFAALPSGQPLALASPQMTTEAAAAFMAEHTSSGCDHRRLLTDPAYLDRCYQQAARRVHPDAGGSDQLMASLNQARSALKDAAR